MQNSDGGISDFRISGQSLIKENYHNFRTGDDIDMKLGPITKLNKRNKITSKKIWRWRHVGKLWRHCHYSGFWSIWRGRIPDTESEKVMFSVIANVFLTKTENRTKKSLTKLSHYCFELRYFFGQKTLIFCKKILTWAKLMGSKY